MPENIRCSECEVTLLGLVVEEAKPLNRDDCPKCGGSDFTPLSQDAERMSTD
jgi:Zn finger protein HypA/HybF involved in hydrogenase expression